MDVNDIYKFSDLIALTITLHLHIQSQLGNNLNLIMTACI